MEKLLERLQQEPELFHLYLAMLAQTSGSLQELLAKERQIATLKQYFVSMSSGIMATERAAYLQIIKDVESIIERDKKQFISF